MAVEIPVRLNVYLTQLLVVAIFFVLVHVGLNAYHYEVEELPWLLLQLFELDEENNLPTWFSSFLLLNNAAVLLVATAQARQHQIQWGILSFGFLVLAIDEVAGMHETFHTAIDTNWTIYAALLVGIVGLFFVPFLLALPRRLAVWFMVSGMIYLGGALVVEWLSRDMDEDTTAYALAVAVEEGMEMAGAWLFLLINLYRLRDEAGSVRLNLA